MAEPTRHVPTPTPETAHFWAGTLVGELRLQRCERCDHTYFPPRPFCPRCHAREVAVVVASGRGRLHSYVISHRGVPWLDTPYVIALVELDEGPRMMTNVVECEPSPEALPIDLPLEVRYLAVSDEIALPLFAPVAAAGADR